MKDKYNLNTLPSGMMEAEAWENPATGSKYSSRAGPFNTSQALCKKN